MKVRNIINILILLIPSEYNLYSHCSQRSSLQSLVDQVKVNIGKIDYMKKKTREKRFRNDKDAVLDMLFALFEKHQYYNIKDLQKLTRQPIVYLKEILKEVCNYNYKNPHKNMWELKPEYRYYKQEQAAETKDDKHSSDSE